MQAVTLGQLGAIMDEQKEYAKAKTYFIMALDMYHTLNELPSEALILHRLGVIAYFLNELKEAEHYYRASLILKEQLGDVANAADTCNNLALVAEDAGRPMEAEGWYKRALGLFEQVQTDNPARVNVLNNLANLLLNEVRVGFIPKIRLADARDYAESALAIREKLEASSEIWTTLSIIAGIADLEGKAEEARNYRRRARETFAAFEGNRYHIDRQHGQLITDIVAALKGDTQVRAKVEAVLPQIEAKGWHIATATKRIWAGERDWHSLAEGLDRQDALLILRVLETIAQPAEVQKVTPEQVFASLPVAIREAMEQGDQTAVEKAFEALSQEEQQAVMEAIQFLQSQQEEDESVAEGGE